MKIKNKIKILKINKCVSYKQLKRLLKESAQMKTIYN